MIDAYKTASFGMDGNGYQYTLKALTFGDDEPAPSCEHDYKAVVTEPTCTEKGYTTYTCSKCGKRYQADETAALGHDFGEWTVTKEAACTADGEQTRACSRCDAKQTQKLDAPGHDFKDGVCTRCGEADPDYAPSVDKGALDQAINAAGLYDENDYTPETFAALKDALDAAETVRAREDATQAEVDAAAAAVNDAITKLEKKPDEPAFLFDDVRNEKSFYFTPVYWAYYARPQITNGMTATTFEPNNGCTRGQVVTFLWRAAGCPEPESTKTRFADVSEKAFYAKAVAWAVEQGITKGMTDAAFAPNDTCTRGQIVTFLWRFKQSPAPKSTETVFTDVSEKAFYAKAVAWAVENGITKGMTDAAFVPNDTCTRGQVVTFLYRAMR